LKGLILSGGAGSRLRPLTHTRAKQLVPVANKPVLFYGIEAMVAAGVTDIGIVVGDTKDEIRAAVGDGSAFGARVSYVEQEAPLGLAHAVLTAEPFIGTDSFVMYLGDNLIQGGIRSLVEEFVKRGPHAQILLTHVPNPEQYGVATLDGTRVVRLEEKPDDPQSDLALVGVYMFDRHIFDAARSIKPSRRGELEITDAIQWLIDRGLTVTPHIVKGWWKDTGKLEDMLEANRIVLDTIEREVLGTVDAKSRIEGKVVLARGAQVVDSVVRGPAIIGEGCRIEHAFVGPYTSVQDRCLIRLCEIENSIVLEGSSLRDLDRRVEGSLIGRQVEIVREDLKPKAYRFMVGDNSRIGF
jgi:glucose-1-phosphate thymidylyltransferase